MNDQSLIRQIAVGLKADLIARMFSMLAKGLLLVVLTRYFMTPDQFGLLFYVISILSVARLFADLGFAKSTARYVSHFIETDETQVRHILRVGLSYNLLMIVIVGTILVGSRDTISSLLEEPALAPLLFIGPAYIGCRSLYAFHHTIFQGFNAVQWSALISTVSSICQFVFVVGFVWLGYGVTGAYVGYVVSFLLASTVGLLILYYQFYNRFDEAETIRADLKKRILKYNVPLAWTRGAGVLTNRVDTVLIGYFITPTAVGFYTLGKQISEFIITPASTLGFVVSPTFGSQKANNELDRAARIYEKSLENILLLYIPAAAGVALIAKPAIRLVFGTDYLGAVPVLQILSLFIIVKAIDKITNDGLDYLGRARERAIVKAVGAVSNFLLNVLLIPRMGVVGAVVATVITTTAVVGTNIILIHRELPLSVGTLIRTTVLVAGVTVVMTAVVWLFLPFITSIVSLAAVVTVGGLVWAVLAAIGGLFDVRAARTLLDNVI